MTSMAERGQKHGEEESETQWWADEVDPNKFWIVDDLDREVEYKWLPVAKSWDQFDNGEQEVALWVRAPKENGREKAWRTAVEIEAY